MAMTDVLKFCYKCECGSRGDFLIAIKEEDAESQETMKRFGEMMKNPDVRTICPDCYRVIPTVERGGTDE